jgi:gamma-glutamyltranspeptidase
MRVCVFIALDIQWKDIAWGSVQHVHTLIEVMRLAFADARRWEHEPVCLRYCRAILTYEVLLRHSAWNNKGLLDDARYIADPESVRVPVSTLLSMEYARSRAVSFDPTRCVCGVRHLAL